MEDYRLIIRVKNNLLYTKMVEHGFDTQSELARVTGLSAGIIGEIANLKIGAFNADGKQSKATQALCDYFGCLPEDIYPPEVLHVGIPKNVIERVVSSQEVAGYLKQQEIDPAYQLENSVDNDFLKQQINRLTPREQKVIKARFYDDKTLQDVGSELGVSGTRIREIEAKALRRLRHVMKYLPDGYDNSDTSPSGLATTLADAESIRRAGE